MIDREKVIKAHECCLNENVYPAIKCADCPYKDTDIEESCIDKLQRDALALLKEQEAVEPLQQNSNGWIRTIKLWYCGACHSKISRRTSKYCPNCGKPILWEGR